MHITNLWKSPPKCQVEGKMFFATEAKLLFFAYTFDRGHLEFVDGGEKKRKGKPTCVCKERNI